MPLSKEPFNPVPIYHGEEYDDYGNPGEDKKSHILMMPYVGAAEGEKDRTEKPARSADDEEFHCGQMPQA